MWTFISTNLRMQLVGENVSQAQALRNQSAAQKTCCPQRHKLSLQCHQREHAVGTACPRAAGHGVVPKEEVFMVEIESQVVPPTPPCINTALMGNESSAEIFHLSPAEKPLCSA